MLKPPHRFRRLAVLAAVALALGVATDTACQAIEHHDSLKDVVALCTAAAALIAAVGLAGGDRRRTTVQLPRWIMSPLLMPANATSTSFSTSPAWLQRFRN